MKTFQKIVAAMTVGAACAHLPAMAQDYPDRPVRILVGFAPGGTNDVLARVIATKLQERLKQPFVVENKPGAASMIAAEAAARSAPDGYTLFVASSGAMTINPALYPKIKYDPVKDFSPIALLGTFPLVITVNTKSPVRDFRGLVAASKQSKTGDVDHAVGSSTFQFAAELLSRESGIKFNHIIYKGTGPAVTALVGGEVQTAVSDIAGVLPMINGGRLRPLAVTTATRSKVLPEVPTLAESGVKGYDVSIWTGLVAPTGTPEAALVKLRSTLNDILKDKEVTERMASLGMEPGHADAAEFSKLIARDLARWGAVAKTSNIKAE